MGELSDDPAITLADLPATPRQRRVVLIFAATLAVSFAVVAPFANRPLPPLVVGWDWDWRFVGRLPSTITASFSFHPTE